MGRATELATTTSSASPEGPAPPSPIPADFASRLAHVGPDAFLASGHAGGRFIAVVYVTPDAKDAFVTSKDLATGTQIVMATVDRTTHKAGPTFFMEKGAPGDAGAAAWRFGIVESPAAKEPQVALCARCHAEAPRDFVFALPANTDR